MTEREDDVDTARMEPVRWLDPVGSRDELPPGAGLQDGSLCYVQKDESVWQVRGGEWTQIDNRSAGGLRPPGTPPQRADK